MHNKSAFPLFRTSFQTWAPFLLTIFLSGGINIGNSQPTSPELAIRELQDGYLLVRLPASRGKIDTLSAMVARTTDPDQKKRLEVMLDRTIRERDALISSYTNALSTEYRFSRSAYYFDYDSRDLTSTTFYNPDGQEIHININDPATPLYFLYFERTEEAKIDALVVYDRNGQKVPAPFPNNFTRSGISFLFLRLMDQDYPAWRMRKINKRLYKYLERVGG